MNLWTVIFISLGVFIVYLYIRYFAPLRKRENGFPYVYVENEGTVRELDEEEQEYLNEKFHPNDGARPYIKSHYDQLTPDGKLHGYLPRRRVPFWIKIR